MALPFYGNFENGVLVNATYGWDSETDTVSQLDICHYKELARYPWKAAPYSGAYCMRAVLSGGTADAFVLEGDVDCADTATIYVKFEVWFSPTFTGTANDTFALFECLGAGSAATVSFGARIVAATNVINLGVGGANTGAVPGTFAAQDIQRGVWYTVELKIVVQTGGTGTVDLYFTRAGEPTQIAAQAQATTITNIAITDGVLGIQDHLATTTGVILFDGFVCATSRIYPQPRYQIDQVFTGVAGSGHAFVGPGWIAGAAIISGTSPTMVLYDTDSANTLSSLFYEISLATAATNQSSIGGHIYFQQGCYVLLGGTTPVGQVLLVRSDINPGVFGPLYYSDSGLKRLARGG